jgi:hypothetical protein
MAAPKIFQRFDALSFLLGLLQQVLTNWTTVSGILGGGALMGYLAYVQELQSLWWGGAFLGGMVLVATVRALNR